MKIMRRLSPGRADKLASGLRFAREMRDLSIREVSLRSGLSHSAISKLETGKTTATISLANLLALLAAYNVPPSLLLTSLVENQQ